jgi:hypothetical protein
MFPNSDFWSEKKPSGWQPWFQLHLLSVNSSFDIASIHLTQVCANFLRSQIELPAKIFSSRFSEFCQLPLKQFPNKKFALGVEVMKNYVPYCNCEGEYGSQSKFIDFLIYNYKASAVVCRLERF